MRLHIAAPGRPHHPGAIAWGADLYDRIGRIVPIERHAAREVRRRTAGPDADARQREAAALRALLPSGAHAVALDPGAKSMDSDAFLRWFVAHCESAGRPLWFVIGGPDGLDAAVLGACRDRLALGPMTLPHELAEVVLLEQLYRALTRWKGLPYHR